MKFEDYPYQRIDIDHLKQQIENLLDEFKASPSVEEQVSLIKDYNIKKKQWITYKNIATVNFNRFTGDESSKREKEFWNSVAPELEELDNKFETQILNSAYLRELKDFFGNHYFNLLDVKQKSFHPKMKSLIEREEKLVDEYAKLQASAEICFEGKNHNLSSIMPFLYDSNRDIRKSSMYTMFNFYQENEEKFDQIFDQLVQVRNEMGLEMGFKNYIPLAYLKLQRMGYAENDISVFRKQILEKVTPIAQKLQNKKCKVLGLENLYIYDTISFKEGNPKPIGDANHLVQQALMMYKEMSPETGDFFQKMIDENLMDLESRPGKSGRGFCDDFPLYGRPYIFSNFNGTANDVTVLTHEAGHAFQGYLSREQLLYDYLWPSTEACEIHSHSMEYFSWPWTHLFFGNDADRFKYRQLFGDFCYLPLAAQVDHFQHLVYSKPSMSPKERKQIWLELDKTYQPWIDYDDIPFLSNGGYWQWIGHHYFAPFYYIDYALALTCAFQFWARSEVNRKEAWMIMLACVNWEGANHF